MSAENLVDLFAIPKPPRVKIEEAGIKISSAGREAFYQCLSSNPTLYLETMETLPRAEGISDADYAEALILLARIKKDRLLRKVPHWVGVGC